MSCVDCVRAASSAAGSVDSGHCLKHVRTSAVQPRQMCCEVRAASSACSMASECKHSVQGRVVKHRMMCDSELQGQALFERHRQRVIALIAGLEACTHKRGPAVAYVLRGL